MLYRVGELIQTFRHGTTVIGSNPDARQAEECYGRTFSRAFSRGGSSIVTDAFDEREQKHPVMGQLFRGAAACETDGLSRCIEHVPDSNRVVIPHIALPHLRGPRP